MEKEGVEPVMAHGASVAPVPTDFPKSDRLDSNQHPPPSQGGAPPLSYDRVKPHQGIEP